ncbi:FAD-dependent oxidoreductase, partial [Candidatus Bathyarchaeota archaeon]|nr:FAD-dependent oxidoreductase [Candidatus Bathyarchaeota archaeon]
DMYDKLPEPGGLPLFAIPNVRIDAGRIREGVKEVLTSYNVNFIGSTKVVSSKGDVDEGDEFARSKIEFSELVSSYHAVLISTGAWRSKSLGIHGEGSSNVFKALDFLFRVKAYELGYLDRSAIPELSGKKVAVIGAGLSAVDAAMEALRMGAYKVYMLYRRTVKEAPAGEKELMKLINMGVLLVDLVIPTKINTSSGLVRSVGLIRCKLGEPDESGRPKPIPIDGSDFELEVDIIINSIGETPTPPVLDNELGIRLGRDGRILVNELRETTRKGVYAAGDVVLGPSKIGLALRDGLIAGRSIGNYLTSI